MSTQYRWLGVTDESTECEKCGKTELRSTVLLLPLDEEGNPEAEPVYFGSTCAARALAVKGGGRAVLNMARGAHHQTLQDAASARRRLAHYGLSETGDVDADAMREAMIRYNRAHPGMAELIQKTGIGTRARVLDMMGRDRSDIARAALVDPKCSYCGYAH